MFRLSLAFIISTILTGQRTSVMSPWLLLYSVYLAASRVSLITSLCWKSNSHYSHSLHFSPSRRSCFSLCCCCCSTLWGWSVIATCCTCITTPESMYLHIRRNCIYTTCTRSVDMKCVKFELNICRWRRKSRRVNAYSGFQVKKGSLKLFSR